MLFFQVANQRRTRWRSCLRSVFEEAVDEREVEFAFLRFKEIPIDGSEHGVQMELLQVSPIGLHVLAIGSAGVAELTTKDQEGSAVDN